MLGDLTAVTDNGAETKTIADGTWHLKFKLEADNSAVELPAGQSIQVGGKTATINKVLLSPIGYNFVYTVDGKAPFENAESGQEPASHRDTWDAFSAKLLINKKDGTVIDVPGNGSSMDPHDGVYIQPIPSMKYHWICQIIHPDPKISLSTGLPLKQLFKLSASYRINIEMS